MGTPCLTGECDHVFDAVDVRGATSVLLTLSIGDSLRIESTAELAIEFFDRSFQSHSRSTGEELPTELKWRAELLERKLPGLVMNRHRVDERSITVEDDRVVLTWVEG